MAIPSLRSNSIRIVLLTALLFAGGAPQEAFAQNASVEPTPAGSAPAGSTVTVKWSGPNGRGDYITIVPKGARPFDYLDYKTTSDGRAPVNPVLLVMPAEPGGYEIRYVRNNPREVLAAVPYEVTGVTALIEGPATVMPDARFEVVWVGPNNGGDYVTIVAAGAAPRAYGSYVDARSGTLDKKTGRAVATLRAPAQPGRYELRYVQRGAVVIGMRAIDVGASSAGAADSSAFGVGASAAGGAAQGSTTGSETLAGARTRSGTAAGAAAGGVSAAAGASPAGAGPAAASSAGSIVSPGGAAAAGAGSAGASAASAAQASPGNASAPMTTTTGSGTASSGQPVARAGTGPINAGMSAIAGGTPTGGGAAGTVDLSQSMKACTTAAAPQFTATPGGVTFTLTKPAGTTGYRISRRDVGELTPAPVTGASYTHAAPLDFHQTYQYVITGIKADGGCTTATATVTPPRPLTPQVSAKVTPGQVTGRVTLSWLTQTDRPTAYLVLGPGLTEAGTEVPASANATPHSVEIGNVPLGTQSWLVTPVWKTPAGIMSDVSLGARVTATVTGTSARFRILLTGFRVNQETNAGTFGEHNAVYAAAAVEVLNRQSNFAVLQPAVMVRSRVHGDTTRDAARIRAGSASSTGGLLAGDSVPGNPAAAGAMPPSTTSFPLALWEGSLTYGREAVIIRPTLWVWNGGQQAFDVWAGMATSQTPDRSGGRTLREASLSTYSSMAAKADLSYRGSTLLTCFMDPVNITGSACGVGRDRPIGVTQADFIPEYNGWRDLVFVITREKIESVLASPYQAAGMPAGVIPIELVDNGPAWNGNYTLYLQLQQIP